MNPQRKGCEPVLPEAGSRPLHRSGHSGFRLSRSTANLAATFKTQPAMRRVLARLELSLATAGHQHAEAIAHQLMGEVLL